MTSNLAGAEIREAVGNSDTRGGALQGGKISEELRKRIHEELLQHFRPEFVNRVDEIVIFHRLTPEHIVQIVILEAKEVGSG